VKIAAIELIRVVIPLRAAFAHASAARASADAILVRISCDEGIQGYGEIQPRKYVTGETHEGVLASAVPRAAGWLGTSVPDFAAALGLCNAALDQAGRELALAGGFELALLDLAGRRFGVPLASALGPVLRDPLPAGVVIGFEVTNVARHAAMLRLSGRRHIKVKVGRDDDETRLRAIASVLPDVALRLDANEAWTADVAIARLQALSAAGVNIASIEQPVPAADLAGLRRVRVETGVPVMADESLCSLDDARALLDVADVFHVRIGKMGGVLGARRIVELGLSHEIGMQLGTMVGETGILGRAAEIFGRCVRGFDCLDGKAQNEHLLSDDVLEAPASARDAPLDTPGLGVLVSDHKLTRWMVGSPISVK